MTSEATVAVSEPSGAPKWWATYTLAGREIHFNAPTPEQLMVLRRLARQLGGDQTPGKAITTMAMILDAVSACMSSDEERDYADQLVLDRKIDFEELAEIIKACLSGPGKEAPKTGPAKRVRRR